jgi:hypothetical protein
LSRAEIIPLFVSLVRVEITLLIVLLRIDVIVDGRCAHGVIVLIVSLLHIDIIVLMATLLGIDLLVLRILSCPSVV